MTADVYVMPVTRIWLRPSCESGNPCVLPGYRRMVTPESLRTIWVALPIGHAYFDYLPFADNDMLARRG